MGIQLDARYKEYPIYAQQIETKEDNPYFTNGDIAVQVYIADSDNFSEVLENGDFIVLKGGAGTKNDFHIVQLIIEDNMVYFEPTSNFLSDLPCKKILLEDIQEAPIQSKIIFTISNRTNQDMLIGLYGIPHSYLKGNKHNTGECIDFTLRLQSERNN